MHYSINFIKLCFIYIIIIFHTGLLAGILNHGYLGVELFFILSGFFIASKAEKNISIKDFFENRIKKLYPHYIYSFLIMLSALLFTGEFINQKYNIIAEIFMAQNLGITAGGVNYPCWYLSVLVFGGSLLYIVIVFFPKFPKKLFLLIIPMSYCGYALFYQCGRMEIWDTLGIFYLPFWRGICDMSIGISLRNVYRKLLKNNLFKYSLIWHIVEIVSALMILISLLIRQNLDVLSILFMGFLILAALNKDSITEKIGSMRLMKRWESIEYPLFLNHAVIITLYKHYFVNISAYKVSFSIVAIILIVTLYSIVTFYLVKHLSKIFCHSRNPEIALK